MVSESRILHIVIRDEIVSPEMKDPTREKVCLNPKRQKRKEKKEYGSKI